MSVSAPLVNSSISSQDATRLSVYILLQGMHRAFKLRPHLHQILKMTGLPFPPSKRATIAEAALTSPYRKVAARFGCSPSTVSRLVKQHRLKGHNRTASRSGRPSTMSPRTLAQIRRVLITHRQLAPHHIISYPFFSSSTSISLSQLFAVICPVLGTSGTLLA